MPSVTVDVVSDLVCPWCFIGARRLATAIAQAPDLAVTLRYRPFLLDPSAPAEGKDLRDHLRRRYGDPEPMFRRVEQVAKDSGIVLDFSKIRRFCSTLRAHTLVRHAADRGTQAPLVDALFRAYFERGEDLSTPAVLIAAGTAHGFTEAEVMGLCESPEELAVTRREAAELSESGVTGVPLFVFGGRFPVHGAQSVEVLTQALRKAAATA